jgi:hypothetical protein
VADRLDFTGRLAEKLLAEQALADGTRTGKIGMVNGDIVIAEEGIWDPFTGATVEPSRRSRTGGQGRPDRATQTQRPSEDQYPWVRMSGYTVLARARGGK